MRKLLTVSLCFLTIMCTTAQEISEVRRITEKLCSPEFHGRGYVNKGDSIASRFIADEFKKAGIEPYGDSYFQNFTINGVNTFPSEVVLKQNERKLKVAVHFLPDPSSGGMNETLHPKEIDISTALDKEKLTSELRSIISNPDYNAIVLNFHAYSKDTLKKIQGLSRALAAFIPVVEVTDEKFTWSVGREQLQYPLIKIQDSVYVTGADLDVKIDAQFVAGYKTQNVIAWLPAKRKCKKTIVFTAHYDHLGRLGSETYFPGANDNASGTAMLLTMAKYFKENPSEYNIMFIAFAGEEAGLLGSEYYTEHPVFKLKKIEFLINLDIMGSGEEGITVVNATLFDDEFKLLQQINAEKKLLAQVKKRGPAANSDHYHFTQKGVPAFFIYTMGPNKNYHDVFDTYEALSFNEYKDITTLLVSFVESLN